MDPDQQRLVGQVYGNALKLLDMINQMLDFSKFEARKMQLRLKQIDLEELASDVVTISSGGRTEGPETALPVGRRAFSNISG